MGIESIFNFVLALRNSEEARTGARESDECIPERLVSGESYRFLKKGQRLFLMTEEIPLVESLGARRVSSPLASIRMLEVTHFVEKGEVWTRGRYMVIETSASGQVRFDGVICIKC